MCGECRVKVSMSWLLWLWQSYYYYFTIIIMWGRFAPWGAQPPAPLRRPETPPRRLVFFVHLMLGMYVSLREKRSTCFSVAKGSRKKVQFLSPYLITPNAILGIPGFISRKKCKLLLRYALRFCFCLSLYLYILLWSFVIEF